MSTTAGSSLFERLPKSIVPTHYNITIKPDLVKLVFEGEECIALKVVEPVDRIVLNSFALEIENPTLLFENGKPIEACNVALDDETEIAVFTFPSVIEPGEYILKLSFRGAIKNNLKGFYCSRYYNVQCEQQYCGVTQFQPTYARRAFPCWDEPAIKATFDVTLVVPEKLIALSNMPVLSEVVHEVDPHLRIIHFCRTPVMSIYLLAYVVGEFDYIEERSTDGVLVRVYTPLGRKEQGRFGLHVAVKALPYFKEYFGVEYPLPKMDLICVADYADGAMENWGLVTFRESYLLVDEENSSTQRRQLNASIIGHELAHQWFGNLVTMEWWTDLWLNEGYANFVESLCVDHIFPDYEIWTQFLTVMWSPALVLDSLKNSHPIEVPVSNPNEIDEIFDDISYQKGASIIRMLHNYIGDEVFRRGMKLYLTRHKYGNTCTEDLWTALGEASSKPVKAVMSGWTKQMGFPVIRVSARQEGENKRIVCVKQQRFFADGTKDDNNTMWMVPVEIATSRSPSTPSMSFVLEGETAEIVLNDIRPNEWLKINPGQVGFYRTCYEPDLLKELVSAIHHQTLPPLDRLGLLDDLFALVQAGHFSTVEVLTLLEAFTNEDQYTVWNRICSVLDEISNVLGYTQYEGLFQKFCRRLLSPTIRKIGWHSKPDEGHLTKLLRSLLLTKMVEFEDAEVIAEAKRRFDKHLTSKEPIPADFRYLIYCAVLQTGGRSEYEQLLELYRKANLQEEKERIAKVLGTVRDEDILKEVLNLAMSEEVTSKVTVYLLSSVASSKVGRELAWNHFKANCTNLYERLNGAFLMVPLIQSLTASFASHDKANDIDKFFQEHNCPGTERTVQQMIETVRINAAWLARDEERLGRFLENKVTSG